MDRQDCGEQPDDVAIGELARIRERAECIRKTLRAASVNDTCPWILTAEDVMEAGGSTD